MISEWEAIRLIQKERSQINREFRGGNTDSARCMMHAFKVAESIVKQLSDKARMERLPYHARGPRWRAEEFYQAIETAHHNLMSGDRKRAIERLQKVIDRVKSEEIKRREQKTSRKLGLPTKLYSVA